MHFTSGFIQVSRVVVLMIAGVFGAPRLAAAASADTLRSPDRRVAVDFSLNDQGAPVYWLKIDGEPVLAESRLGLTLGDVDFTGGLTLVGRSGVERVKETYELATAKRRLNTYEAKRRTYRLATAAGQRIDVVFQVSNDGVAFRYVFPEAGEAERVVLEDATSFHLPVGARAWLQPMSVAKTGWSRTNPSYEEYYQLDIAAGTPSTLGAGWVFPALFRTGKRWVLISEAGVGRGYCASRLRHESPGGEYRIGFPDARETIGAAPVGPRFTTPYTTPWRVIAAGELRTVVESTLGTDVADPAAAGAFVPPTGLAAWSWPKRGDAQTTFPVQKEFIDYAAALGWRYCLIDALWDTQIGEGKLKELVAYARAKNVDVLVWYNSNGDWNDAFQTPKNRLLTRDAMRAEFAKLREIGVKGVKVDFFGGDGRAFMELYQDLMAEGAAAGLAMNFHGATLPRGWGRTYPNLLTTEAVRGYEFITFEQANADRAPSHVAMLPFARNVFDPMDFTPFCVDGPRKIKRRTSLGFELASTVVLTSGIQHIVETPDGLAKQPDYVRDFLRRVPAAWEETRFLAGEPGKLAVFGRLGADGVWRVAGINGEAVRKTVEVDLAVLVAPGQRRAKLGGSMAYTLITDGVDGGWVRSEGQLAGKTRILRVELLPAGGFVAELAKPAP
jgi:hypothetical protein